MPKTPQIQTGDVDPVKQGLESIMMTVKNVASGLVVRYGGYHPDAPSNPYSVKVGGLMLKAKDTHSLQELVVDELLRRLPPHCPPL